MDGQEDRAGGQAEGPESGPESGPVETKRARVRRCLLDPLGFRFRREVDEAAQRQFLDGLADELGYMAEDRLRALADMLRPKGQGSARNLWPDRATFVAFAELVQPRPLEELPALLSWFGSVEGPRAMAAGELVEVWDYITRRKAPPYSDQARKMVAEAAGEANRRLKIVEERQAAGLGVRADEVEWARRYLAARARCEAIVARERAARGHGDAGVAA